MNGRMRAVFAAVLILAASGIEALELRDGRILLTIDEKTARFTLHYLSDAARNRYVALLYEQEPRTSFPTLSWNGKSYRLGESPDFRFTVRREDENAVIEYRSSFASVRQVFRPVRSAPSSETDGVLIEYAIENLSGSTARAGLRLVWDTYLGEKGKRHFEIDGLGVVSGELSLAGASVPRSAISPGEGALGLQMQFAGEGVSRPDRFLVANWKRINDSGWSFEVTPGRSFTLLPYSIDDSAAAVYYEPAELRDGTVRTIRAVLGNRSDSGYAVLPAGGGDSVAIVILPPTGGSSAPGAASDPFVTARTDIAALREIIQRIDGILASGKDPSPEQLEELRSLLALIRNRRKGL